MTLRISKSSLATIGPTAEMDAGSFVNGNKSSVVRENLDGLFDGLSGGNNSYISTDERELYEQLDPHVLEPWIHELE